MNAWVWVLAITVLGTSPEHHYFAKYQSKEECQQALDAAREEYRAKKKQIASTCTLVLKNTK